MKEGKKYSLRMKVNGMPYRLRVEAHRTLLDVLREDLGLTGVKEGCGMGECGSCTVLVGGRPVKSCILLAVEADGQSITTVEGLGKPGSLDPLQKAFAERGAIQCGFCTPGMIMAAKALLLENPSPSHEEICNYLSGNICRCTGYVKIIDAVKAVASGEQK